MKSLLQLLLLIAITSLGNPAISHPGRTDSNGGHVDASTSVYHCHSLTCGNSIIDKEPADDEKTRYRREDWKHWIDEDGDCQNTRAELLISRSEVKVEFATSRECRVVGGFWIGGLTGIVLSDASNVDIDHVIPLSYAHRHGGFSWSSSKKEQFANDPLNLLIAYDIENRRKSDKGPSEYLPSNKNLACVYIKRWKAIGIKYGLNIPSDDMFVIRDIISNTASEQSC